MVGVVVDGLAHEPLHVRLVLEPARLGHDGERAAELAGHVPEAVADLGHGQGRPFTQESVVHRVASRVPLLVPANDRRTRLIHGELTSGNKGDLQPTDEMAHQVATGPGMRSREGDLELLVGQVIERLERAKGVALLLEELEGIEIHHASHRTT